VSTLAIPRSSGENKAMIQSGASGVEALARDNAWACRFHAREGFDKTHERTVLAGHDNVQRELRARVVLEQLSHDSKLDAPTERPAAHDPGINIQAGIDRAPLQDGDLAERAKLVLVGNNRQPRALP